MFGEDFRGPQIPFGASVQYKPSLEKDIAKLHQFGTKMLNGIFLGYSQRAGGGWNGDFLLIDVDQLHNAEHINDVYTKRIKAKEVIVQKDCEKFVFPAAYGDVNQPGDGPKVPRPKRKKRGKF